MEAKFASQKGMALPLTLIALMVGALLIAPFLGYVSAALKTTGLSIQALERQYAAEAGAEYGIWKLKYETEILAENWNGWSWDGERIKKDSPIIVNKKNVEISIKPPRPPNEWKYELTSTATGPPGKSTEVKTTVRISPAIEYAPGYGEGEYYGEYKKDNGDIDVPPGVTINGNVYAEGNVTLRVNTGEIAKIIGNVYARGDVELKGDDKKQKGAVIEGNVYAGRDVILREYAEVTGNVYAWNKVELKEGAEIVGNVYAGWNVDVKEKAKINGNVYIYPGGNITVKGDVQGTVNKDVVWLLFDLESLGTTERKRKVDILLWEIN